MMDVSLLKLGGFRSELSSNLSSNPNFEQIKSQLIEHVGSSYEGQISDLSCFSIDRHNQLPSSSCVAQSIIKAAEMKRVQKFYNEAISRGLSTDESLKIGLKNHINLSRLALYYLSREMMTPQEIDKDAGTHISLAASCLAKFGVCREEKDPNNPNDVAFWPFDLSKILVSPDWRVMREASLHKIKNFYMINSSGDDLIRDVILALSSGNPVAYGTIISEEWQQYNSTSSPLGLLGGKKLGGHATVLLGWDPIRQLFFGENSWGENWGISLSGNSGGFYEIRPEVISENSLSGFAVLESGYETWLEAA